jgi:adenosylcobinamide-GDP ribazoletransferase
MVNMAFKVFRNLLSMLTSIPMKTDSSFVEISAHFMYLFPIIGVVIGLFAGSYWYIANYLLNSLFSAANRFFVISIPFLSRGIIMKGLTSLMTLSFILVLTGLQHIDGLIDTGNALGMRKSVEDRRNIAHAWVVTRLGALVALIVMFFTFLFIFFLSQNYVIRGLLVSEVSAKIGMVTCAWLGKPASSGLGAAFVKSMKHKHGLYLISLITSYAVSFLALGATGLTTVSSGIIVGLLMIGLSNKVFGWMTGDIFGATNEVARLAALISLVVQQWVFLH